MFRRCYSARSGVFFEVPLNEALLDPDCVEARGWNLSASQYKPFNFEAVISDKSVAEMIKDLKKKEMQVMEGLERLLAMVEAAE